MKLKEFLDVNGSRATAEKLVNLRLLNVVSLEISDLPDRTELWDIVEEIEEILNTKIDIDQIKNTLKVITIEYIEELCW
jgi:hypothetical protein